MHLLIISLILLSLHLLVKSGELVTVQVNTHSSYFNKCTYGCYISIYNEFHESTKFHLHGNSRELIILKLNDEFLFIDGIQIQCNCEKNYLGIKSILLFNTVSNKVYERSFGRRSEAGMLFHKATDLSIFADFNLIELYPLPFRILEAPLDINCYNYSDTSGNLIVLNTSDIYIRLHNVAQIFAVSFTVKKELHQYFRTSIAVYNENWNQCIYDNITSHNDYLLFLCNDLFGDTIEIMSNGSIFDLCLVSVYGRTVPISYNKHTGSLGIDHFSTVNAVDGNSFCAKSIFPFHSKYSHTLASPNQKANWFVDLGHRYFIQYVYIDHYISKYYDFRYIDIKIGFDLQNMTDCATFTGPPVRRHQSHLIFCEGHTQFVLIETSLPNLLLCEVQVFEPIHGGFWADWAPFSQCFCNGTFDLQVKFRKRVCVVQEGKECGGPDIDVQFCYGSTTYCHTRQSYIGIVFVVLFIIFLILVIFGLFYKHARDGYEEDLLLIEQEKSSVLSWEIRR